MNSSETQRAWSPREKQSVDAGRQRVLLIVGYGYFFGDFYQKLILDICRYVDFDIWFDGHAGMFSQESFERAHALKLSNPHIFEVRKFEISLAQSMLKNVPYWRSIVDLKQRLEKFEELALQKGYSSVIIMNSALLNYLPIVSTLKKCGLRVVVVRPTILEAPFQRILRFALQDEKLSRSSVAILRSRMWAEAWRKILQNFIRSFSLKGRKGPVGPQRGPFLLKILKNLWSAALTVPALYFIPVSMGLGIRNYLSAVVQAEFNVGNKKYTDVVIIPDQVHVEHLKQIFPGPEYRSYGRILTDQFPDEVHGARGLNILLPLSGETSHEALTLLQNCLESLVTDRTWSFINYRFHPRELNNISLTPMLRIIREATSPSTDVSDLSFSDFCQSGGDFLVVGSSAAVVSISSFRPTARIGIVSIDFGEPPGEDGRYLHGFGNSYLIREAEDAQNWLSTFTLQPSKKRIQPSLQKILCDVLLRSNP